MPPKKNSYTYDIGIGTSTNKASSFKNPLSLASLKLAKSPGRDSLPLVALSGLHETGKHSKKCTGLCTE